MEGVGQILGIMEPIERILGSSNAKDAQKPFLTLCHLFVKPKHPIAKEQRKDAVYSISYSDCDQVYIGQAKR